MENIVVVEVIVDQVILTEVVQLDDPLIEVPVVPGERMV